VALWELLLIAVGLSMDAFAVSIGKGLSVRKATLGHALTVGLYFGGFQALMPVAGYLLGAQFGTLITDFDHWVAFLLLAIIGARMIREGLTVSGQELDDSFGVRTMLMLAIATSIDAAAVGVSLALLNEDIVPAVALIGVVTFAISVVGFRLGAVFGARYKARAEIFGGVVLIALGVKILLDHLGVPG
jgi:putative Mn2+ efflux pump MntP